MVPAERFHGWLKEVDRELSRMVEEGITLEACPEPVEGVVAEKLEGVIPIFAFKGCPETKAVLEGEFGNLEREFGTVRIQGGDKRELAKGTLKTMVDLYVSLRNQKPRCSICSRTPLNLMEEEASPQKLQQAKGGLKERQKRSLALKEDPSAKPEKPSLIEDILTRAGLYLEDRASFIFQLTVFIITTLLPGPYDVCNSRL